VAYPDALDSTCNTNSTVLLKNTNIKELITYKIEQLNEVLAEKSAVTREWIIKGLAGLATDSEKDGDRINAYKGLGSLVCDTDKTNININNINPFVQSNYTKIMETFDSNSTGDKPN
jgi:hypothetical protein